MDDQRKDLEEEKSDDELTHADFFEMMTDRPTATGRSTVYVDLDWYNKHGDS